MSKSTSKHAKPKARPIKRNPKAARHSANITPEVRREKGDSKLATVIQLLSAKEGTTLEQIMKATGWQAHSVRGCMSGALKKRRGLTITSAMREGVRRYRLQAA